MKNNASDKSATSIGLRVQRLVRRDLWNKCDTCGRIIPYADLENRTAIHRMKTPDSEVSYETWETLCRSHYLPNVKIRDPRQ